MPWLRLACAWTTALRLQLPRPACKVSAKLRKIPCSQAFLRSVPLNIGVDEVCRLLSPGPSSFRCFLERIAHRKEETYPELVWAVARPQTRRQYRVLQPPFVFLPRQTC